MSYLLDTNVVIHFLDASLPIKSINTLNQIVDDAPMVSVVTKMELLGFNFTSIDEQTIMETFINNCNVIDINNDIVAKTISIRKTKKIKLPDAIIAATAIVGNFTLITSDPDFKNISELKVIDPHSL